MSCHVERYATWGEFLDRAETRPNPPEGGKSRSTESDRLYFTHTGTFGEALALARDGWPEGEQHIRRLSLAMFDRVSTLIERPVYRYDVEGSDFDVARVVDGEPEHWTRQETITTEDPGRRVVRIVLNIAASAGVGANEIRAKGAAVAALAELLDHAGHGSQIDIAAPFEGSGTRSEVHARIKDADQPLDLPRVAFALAHPSCLRRIVWAIREGHPPAIRRAQSVDAHGGYATPADVVNEYDKGDLYIGRSYYGEPQWANEAAARAWVIEQLKTQGVHLRETDAA